MLLCGKRRGRRGEVGGVSGQAPGDAKVVDVTVEAVLNNIEPVGSNNRAICTIYIIGGICVC